MEKDQPYKRMGDKMDTKNFMKRGSGGIAYEEKDDKGTIIPKPFSDVYIRKNMMKLDCSVSFKRGGGKGGGAGRKSAGRGVKSLGQRRNGLNSGNFGGEAAGRDEKKEGRCPATEENAARTTSKKGGSTVGSIGIGKQQEYQKERR